VSYKNLTELISSEKIVKFRPICRQLKFQPNHMWVSYNLLKKKIAKYSNQSLRALMIRLDWEGGRGSRIEYNRVKLTKN